MNYDRDPYDPPVRRRRDSRPQRSRSRTRDERKRTEPTKGETRTKQFRDEGYSSPRPQRSHHRDRLLPTDDDEVYINEQVKRLDLDTNPDGKTYVRAEMSTKNVATKGKPTTGTEQSQYRNDIEVPQDCLKVVPKPRRNSSREKRIVPLVRGTASPTKRPSAQSAGRLRTAPPENTYAPSQERVTDGRFSDEPSHYDQGDSGPDGSRRRSHRRISSRSPDHGSYSKLSKTARLEDHDRPPDSHLRSDRRATLRQRESFVQETALTQRSRAVDSRPHDSGRRSQRPTQTDTTRLGSPSAEERRPRRDIQTGTSKTQTPEERHRASTTSQRRGSDEVIMLQSGEYFFPRGSGHMVQRK